ncbi:MAG: hypothetical protein KDM91_21380, partial [Verrucomicrobiae bacterium]|nr:hypothetical protein [Verrucomicrobiae bacterium]
FGKGTLWEGAPEPVVAALSRPMEKGEAALGQAGRTETRGEIAEETGGLKAVEQVTADRMKKVEARPEAVSGKDSSKEANP